MPIQCPKSAIRTEMFPWASDTSTEFTTGSTSMSGTWTTAGKDSAYQSNNVPTTLQSRINGKLSQQ